MFNRGILLTERIPPEELNFLVQQLGGEWQNENNFPLQACFSKNDISVFLRGIESQVEDLQFVDPSDLQYGKEKCGKIEAILTVDFSKRNSGSAEFAEKLCLEILKLRDGVVID